MQINVLEYFEKNTLLRSPRKTAIIDGEKSYTHKEVEVLAKRIASVIARKGIGTRRPVAVFLPKGAGVVVADLGIAYSGNIYVNLDIKSPAQRMKRLLDNIGPDLVITAGEFEGSLAGLGLAADRLILIESAAAEDVAYDNGEILSRLEGLLDTDPLCIINTSGSTGLQKSVVLNHRSFIDFTDWAVDRLRIGEDEVIGSLSPVFFDIYSFELCLMLARGSTIVFIPDKLAGFPARIVEFLTRQGINFIFWVPTVMVNIANLDILGKVEPPPLRKVIFAGEVFPTKHLNYWRRRLPGATFVNLYGPIEITLDCTYYVLEREFSDDEPVPIGFPCRNTDILILNDEDRPAGTGEPGELCVRGTGLAMGYWNDPVNTAKAFVRNPLNPHYPETIYRTGDLVYRNERSEIMFIGRKDFQIKHLGYRIELGEVEHAVLSAIEAIDNACVLYHKEKKEIVLVYEAKKEIPLADLRQRLLQLLPKYMIPTAFHRLAEMPRNPNGKIDRNLLNSRLQEGRPWT
ncbi:MAG TPA: amino acid adenylation domain-containing protein [Candidatus Aminicenantes bacterium]|nr:amino acid adenylation domain-containing protein [Candidatus Aminicenantes bacterium]HRY65741.1 amino acid adenylation domain-containing protein [Candidatus Aminicenantes bacterium]HRZ72655.1 amino acid adenylation domain-containing protein [Candidatus Aminicenantes bacterium]